MDVTSVRGSACDVARDLPGQPVHREHAPVTRIAWSLVCTFGFGLVGTHVEPERRILVAHQRGIRSHAVDPAVHAHDEPDPWISLAAITQRLSSKARGSSGTHRRCNPYSSATSQRLTRM
jgi:hypothetical protein